MQPAAAHPLLDRLSAQAECDELVKTNHPVLGLSHLRDDLIDRWGGFDNHW
jgi:hypothetical protein